jgi:hypothetical protein
LIWEGISDEDNAGAVLDPLSSNNHKDPTQVQWWNGKRYTYSKKFSLPAEMHSAAGLQLVFDGIKLGAVISLNGHVLGNTTNQHLRYTFGIEKVLAAAGAENTLTVTFHREIPNGGRFMACSGGWVSHHLCVLVKRVGQWLTEGVCPTTGLGTLQSHARCGREPDVHSRHLEGCVCRRHGTQCCSDRVNDTDHSIQKFRWLPACTVVGRWKQPL